MKPCSEVSRARQEQYTYIFNALKAYYSFWTPVAYHLLKIQFRVLSIFTLADHCRSVER